MYDKVLGASRLHLASMTNKNFIIQLMHNIQFSDTVKIIKYYKCSNVFRITEDPSSGSLEQCLAKNYKNGSIVSVDMDKVGVTAAYCDLL